MKRILKDLHITIVYYLAKFHSNRAFHYMDKHLEIYKEICEMHKGVNNEQTE